MARRGSREPPVSFFAFQDIITSVSGIMILVVLLMALQAVSSRGDGESTAKAKKYPDRSADIETLKNELTRLTQQAGNSAKKEPATVPNAVDAAREAVRLTDDTARLQRETAQWRAAERELSSKLSQITNALADTALSVATNSARIRDIQARLKRAADSKSVTLIPDQASSKSAVLVECSASIIRCGRLSSKAQPDSFDTDSAGLKKFREYVSKCDATSEYFVMFIKPDGVTAYRKCIAIALASGFDVGWDALEQDKSIGFGGG